MTGFITLEDAKQHLVDVPDDDDAAVQRLIDAASSYAEGRTGYVAVQRDESFLFDRFGRQLELRLRPVDLATITVSYLDGNGSSQAFTDFRTIEKHGTIRILPAIGFRWPIPVCAAGAVTVDATVGLAHGRGRHLGGRARQPEARGEAAGRRLVPEPRGHHRRT
jgi:hypothetical protein